MPAVTGSKQLYRSIKLFTSRWVKDHLKPLDIETDVSFESWLEDTGYEEWRKAELREVYENVLNPLQNLSKKRREHFLVDLFAKDENYLDFKHARGIYARDDIAKCYFGPYFKRIEDQLYKNPSFIKHVPVSDRAAYIYDKLHSPGAVYVQTDYTSYESHFSPELMQACEFVLYKYMLRGVLGGSEALYVMKEVLQGVNPIKNKFFSCAVLACRMSGEMNTSLGNGFSNLMLYSYQCYKLGVPVNGVVEGDDGLFAALPGQHPTTDMFTKSGCIIKLNVFERISDASFCGLLFDETDKQIITDPLKVLLKFGWTTKQYANAGQRKLTGLLRAKAMSFMVQYPGCPLVAALSRYGMRVSRGYDVRKLISRKGINEYERELSRYALANFHKYMDVEIGIQTRLLFEELFGIDVMTQLVIEEYFDNKNDLSPINLDLISDVFPTQYGVYWNNYVIAVTRQSDMHNFIETYPYIRHVAVDLAAL
uniref:RNA-directed RNA polymerase n=1 Tax=Melipona quadrifasciata virus 2 TaxID=2571178 RepID=A0A4D6NSZ7_9VIRU|nr:nonstructural protein [Melipona quadrifasciata virus 2]